MNTQVPLDIATFNEWLTLDAEADRAMPGWLEKTQISIRGLLLEYRSPRQLAFALAIGIFIGASPLWGLHTLLALGAAFVFHLNKSAVLLGSFISNPWFAPFLIYSSLHVGSLLLHSHYAPLGFHQIKGVFKHPQWHDLLDSYFLPYFCGAFLVAFLLASCSYLFMVWLAKRSETATPVYPPPRRDPPA